MTTNNTLSFSDLITILQAQNVRSIGYAADEGKGLQEQLLGLIEISGTVGSVFLCEMTDGLNDQSKLMSVFQRLIVVKGLGYEGSDIYIGYLNPDLSTNVVEVLCRYSKTEILRFPIEMSRLCGELLNHNAKLEEPATIAASFTSLLDYMRIEGHVTMSPNIHSFTDLISHLGDINQNDNADFVVHLVNKYGRNKELLDKAKVPSSRAGAVYTFRINTSVSTPGERTKLPTGIMIPVQVNGSVTNVVIGDLGAAYVATDIDVTVQYAPDRIVTFSLPVRDLVNILLEQDGSVEAFDNINRDLGRVIANTAERQEIVNDNDTSRTYDEGHADSHDCDDAIKEFQDLVRCLIEFGGVESSGINVTVAKHMNPIDQLLESTIVADDIPGQVRAWSVIQRFTTVLKHDAHHDYKKILSLMCEREGDRTQVIIGDFGGSGDQTNPFIELIWDESPDQQMRVSVTLDQLVPCFLNENKSLRSPSEINKDILAALWHEVLHTEMAKEAAENSYADPADISSPDTHDYDDARSTAEGMFASGYLPEHEAAYPPEHGSDDDLNPPATGPRGRGLINSLEDIFTKLNEAGIPTKDIPYALLNEDQAEHPGRGITMTLMHDLNEYGALMPAVLMSKATNARHFRLCFAYMLNDKIKKGYFTTVYDYQGENDSDVYRYINYITINKKHALTSRRIKFRDLVEALFYRHGGLRAAMEFVPRIAQLISLSPPFYTESKEDSFHRVPNPETTEGDTMATKKTAAAAATLPPANDKPVVRRYKAPPKAPVTVEKSFKELCAWLTGQGVVSTTADGEDFVFQATKPADNESVVGGVKLMDVTFSDSPGYTSILVGSLANRMVVFRVVAGNSADEALTVWCAFGDDVVSTPCLMDELRYILRDEAGKLNTEDTIAIRLEDVLTKDNGTVATTQAHSSATTDHKSEDKSVSFAYIYHWLVDKGITETMLNMMGGSRSFSEIFEDAGNPFNVQMQQTLPGTITLYVVQLSEIQSRKVIAISQSDGATVLMTELDDYGIVRDSVGRPFYVSAFENQHVKKDGCPVGVVCTTRDRKQMMFAATPDKVSDILSKGVIDSSIQKVDKDIGDGFEQLMKDNLKNAKYVPDPETKAPKTFGNFLTFGDFIHKLNGYTDDFVQKWTLNGWKPAYPQLASLASTSARDRVSGFAIWDLEINLPTWFPEPVQRVIVVQGHSGTSAVFGFFAEPQGPDAGQNDQNDVTPYNCVLFSMPDGSLRHNVLERESLVNVLFTSEKLLRKPDDIKDQLNKLVVIGSYSPDLRDSPVMPEVLFRKPSWREEVIAKPQPIPTPAPQHKPVATHKVPTSMSALVAKLQLSGVNQDTVTLDPTRPLYDQMLAFRNYEKSPGAVTVFDVYVGENENDARYSESAVVVYGYNREFDVFAHFDGTTNPTVRDTVGVACVHRSSTLTNKVRMAQLDQVLFDDKGLIHERDDLMAAILGVRHGTLCSGVFISATNNNHVLPVVAAEPKAAKPEEKAAEKTAEAKEDPKVRVNMAYKALNTLYRIFDNPSNAKALVSGSMGFAVGVVVGVLIGGRK